MVMKKRVQDIDIENKRVVLRCDFNVPIKDGVILDDSKIKASLKTINYLLDKNCKIIILSHLGKIKSEEDKLNNSLEVVAVRLKELINSNVIFSRQTRSTQLQLKALDLKFKDILLLENTRFEDYPSKLESNCDSELAEFWASLGEVFVMDAFATSHRKHASTYGIGMYIPSCIGFLVQEELDALNNYILKPRHPFTIIMGGAKIDDKLELIEKLITKCDYMLLTGGIANSALKSLGLNVGSSLSSNDKGILDRIKSLIVQYPKKFVLPIDVIVGTKYDDSYIDVKGVNELDINDSIYDIGSKSLEKYSKYINISSTIFVNGTAGLYEDKRYSNGTYELLKLVVDSNAKKIAGGGDCLSAINKFNLSVRFDYLSTGGGATLDYIIKESAIALDTIEDEEEVL
jgi:phosphoglycerate kinase